MKTALIVLGVVALLVLGNFVYSSLSPAPVSDPTPKATTLSGVYECLPHADTSGSQTEECAFGIVTDEGIHYAVNFGQAAERMEQFQAGARVTAEGFIVPKEALSTDHWNKYDMKGIFTVTKILRADVSTPQGKLDIQAVCESALAYMTFPNGASAEAFVRECVEGKHPEVIEQYKQQMGLGDGANI